MYRSLPAVSSAYCRLLSVYIHFFYLSCQLSQGSDVRSKTCICQLYVATLFKVYKSLWWMWKIKIGGSWISGMFRKLRQKASCFSKKYVDCHQIKWGWGGCKWLGTKMIFKNLGYLRLFLKNPQLEPMDGAFGVQWQETPVGNHFLGI